MREDASNRHMTSSAEPLDLSPALSPVDTPTVGYSSNFDTLHGLQISIITSTIFGPAADFGKLAYMRGRGRFPKGERYDVNSSGLRSSGPALRVVSLSVNASAVITGYAAQMRPDTDFVRIASRGPNGQR